MKDAVNIRASHHASSHGSTVLKEILALDNKISDAVRMVYVITISVYKSCTVRWSRVQVAYTYLDMEVACQAFHNRPRTVSINDIPEAE
jgi:hypothetical protein